MLRFFQGGGNAGECVDKKYQRRGECGRYDTSCDLYDAESNNDVFSTVNAHTEMKDTKHTNQIRVTRDVISGLVCFWRCLLPQGCIMEQLQKHQAIECENFPHNCHFTATALCYSTANHFPTGY